MFRFIPNKETLKVDVQEVYDIIEQDIINNIDEVVNRYEYYTKKYRGDRLNDINVGIFQNELNRAVIQIYVTNEDDTILTRLILSRDMKRISVVDEIVNTLNNEIEENIMQIKLEVYGELPLETRLEQRLLSLVEATQFNSFEITKREIDLDSESIIFTLKGSK